MIYEYCRDDRQRYSYCGKLTLKAIFGGAVIRSLYIAPRKDLYFHYLFILKFQLCGTPCCQRHSFLRYSSVGLVTKINFTCSEFGAEEPDFTRLRRLHALPSHSFCLSSCVPMAENAPTMPTNTSEPNADEYLLFEAAPNADLVPANSMPKFATTF